jgi:hypothetical protein
VQLEGERAIRDTRLLRYLDLVHAACPLVAVVFQEGQFLGGAGLVDLDDVALVRAPLQASSRDRGRARRLALC